MAVFAAQHHHQSVSCDTLKMNQLCKVCGEPAAGFHFGAFTCEGCKSFFGRSYNNLSVISECKNGGQCVINKKNRTSCKACRLRKCLLVGMSKSGSRYGRRSNWFKIHCLLQEQTGLDAPLGAGVGGVGPNSLLYNGLHRFSPDAIDTSRTTPEEENNSSPSDLVRSPSSMTSSEHSDEAEEPSKENLRLLLTATPHYDPPESGINHNYRKRKILRTASPEAAGPSSPKAGLLAQSGHPILYHPVTSPKFPPESSSSGRHSGYGRLSPHSLYQLITRAPSSVYGEDVPEQEGPIDLSCKTSMSPASSASAMCHIRAEILTAGIGVHRENDGAPLDLTTKA